MQISLYNTLSRSVVPFKPIDANEVRVYSCGPTVYNYAHIGNMRAFLCADLLQRVLRVVGEYRIRWVMNITDIDDRIIARSAVDSQDWQVEMGPQTDDVKENLRKYTEYYTEKFVADLGLLGVRRNDFYAMPKATEYVAEMQELVRNIVNSGFAYVQNGSVYFNVKAWHQNDHYGKLLKVDFENFQEGVRIDADEYERDQVHDFVLWKGRKEGEPAWDFEIDGQACPGRPGWHLECSAMEKALLGVPFDIHTGGIDLRFPHHEDEIAQSKAGYGVEPTSYWFHNEFLEVEGEKMAKRLDNFFTLQDLLQKGYDPLDIRYLMFSAQYSSVLNFTFAGLQAAGKARERIQTYIHMLHEEPRDGQDRENASNVDAFRTDVFSDLADDLNTPKALGKVFAFIRDHPAAAQPPVARAELIEFFRDFNKIFAVWQVAPKPAEEIHIPDDVSKWAEERLDARRSRDFGKADALRAKISEAGFVVKDTKDGYELEVEK